MRGTLFALAGVTVFASVAAADFVGVSMESFDGGGDAAAWAANGYTGLVTYRLYADFNGDDGSEGVLSGFGVEDLPASASSYDGSFYNHATGGLTAPLDLRGSGLWDNQWDSYVTINATTQTGDATSTSPGFDAETGGLTGDWTSENVGWFVTPDDDQSRTVGQRVLLGQFTVAAGGENTIGNPDVSGVIHLLLLGGSQVQNLQFSSAPAPGALALLGLAGLAGTRRRRA